MIQVFVDPHSGYDVLLSSLLGKLNKVGECLVTPYGAVTHPKARRIYLTPTEPTAMILDQFRDDARVVNSVTPQLVWADKHQTNLWLGAAGVPVPRAFCALGSHDPVWSLSQSLIFKNRTGCGGNGHFVLDPARRLAYAPGKRQYHFTVDDGAVDPQITGQELLLPGVAYLETLLQSDEPVVYRVYVVGNQPKFISVRRRDSFDHPGDRIVNAARGARYELLHLEDRPELEKVARQITAKYQLDVAAIDILIVDGQPYVLEINAEGIWVMICRKFYDLGNPDPAFDLDQHIVDWLTHLLGP